MIARLILARVFAVTATFSALLWLGANVATSDGTRAEDIQAWLIIATIAAAIVGFVFLISTTGKRSDDDSISAAIGLSFFMASGLGCVALVFPDPLAHPDTLRFLAKSGLISIALHGVIAGINALVQAIAFEARKRH